MGHHRFVVQVRAPREQVFDLWTDLDRAHEWLEGLTRITDVTRHRLLRRHRATARLLDFVHAHAAVLALAGLDPDLRADLEQQDVLRMIQADQVFDSVPAAAAAFRAQPSGKM